MSASSPALNTSPEPMRTWKMEGPPEIVAGMVMKVMTSCSLRPASRARNPPMAWMPSCELPARRMAASEILLTLGAPPADGAAMVESFMCFGAWFCQSVQVTSGITLYHYRPLVNGEQHLYLIDNMPLTSISGRAAFRGVSLN